MSEQNTGFFYPRKFVLMAIGFGAGIALGKLLLGPFAYAVILIGLLFALIAYLLKIKLVPLLLLMLALGLFRLQIAYPTLPEPSASCELNGKIALPPQYKANSIRVVLNEATCNGYPVDGRVLLTIKNTTQKRRLFCGETLSTTASVSLPQGARNFGSMDMRFHYFSKGIVATAFSGAGFYRVLSADNSIIPSILELREKSTAALISMLGEENGALAAGMLHGGTEDIQPEVLSNFRAAGIAHLLAVSGLHVGLLIGALLFLLRRTHIKVQFAAAMGFLTVYCIFSAFSEATVRASIMALCFLLSQILWRRPDTLSSLCLAFLLILAVSPFSLFSAGFQLSFSAVLGLLLLYEPIKRIFSSLNEPAADALSVSVSASISTMPISALHFKNLPMLAVFANLLAVPLAALAVLPAFCALLLYPAIPQAASCVAWVAGTTLNMMRAVAELASRPAGLNIPSPSFGAFIMFFCSCAFISEYFRGPKKEKRLLAFVSAILCIFLWALPMHLLSKEHVTVLDLPSGYALHMRENGKDLLIGTNEALMSSQVKDYIQAACLKSYETNYALDIGTELVFKNRPVHVANGNVIFEGNSYNLKRTGQLRIYLKRNRLHASAYALDERYAILVEKPRASINLESIWTMHNSTRSLQKAQ